MKKKVLQAGIMVLLLLLGTTLQLSAQYPPPYIENAFDHEGGNDRAADVVALCDGGFAYAGWATETGTGGTFGQHRSAYVHVVNEDGTTRWQFTYDGNGQGNGPYVGAGFFNDVIVNAANNIVAIGEIRPFDTHEDHVFVVELDPCDGSVIRENHFGKPSSLGIWLHLRGKSIAQDPNSGAYFVCAESQGVYDLNGYNSGAATSVVLNIDANLQYNNIWAYTAIASLQGDGTWPPNLPVPQDMSELRQVIYTPGGGGIPSGFIVCGFVTNDEPNPPFSGDNQDIIVHKFSLGNPALGGTPPAPIWTLPVIISQTGVTGLSGQASPDDYSEESINDTWSRTRSSELTNDDERADHVTLVPNGGIVVSGLFNFASTEQLHYWSTMEILDRDGDGVLIRIQDVATGTPSGPFPNFNVAHFSGTDFSFKTEWNNASNRFVSVGSNNDAVSVPDERVYVIETVAPGFDLNSANVPVGARTFVNASGPLPKSNGFGIATTGNSCIAICGDNFYDSGGDPTYNELDPAADALFELMCPASVSPPSILTMSDLTPCLANCVTFTMNACPTQTVVLYVDGPPLFQDILYAGAPGQHIQCLPPDAGILGPHTAYLRVYNGPVPTNQTEFDNFCFEVSLDFTVEFCGCPSPATHIPVISELPPVGLTHCFYNSGSPGIYDTWTITDIATGVVVATGQTIDGDMDGIPGPDDPFCFTFTAAGTYQVCMEQMLLIPDGEGNNICCIYTTCIEITIDNCEFWQLSADINVNRDPNDYLKIDLTYTGFMGDGTHELTIIWTYGDGSPPYISNGSASAPHNHSYTYTSGGTHNVRAYIIWSTGPLNEQDPEACCCTIELLEEVDIQPCNNITFHLVSSGGSLPSVTIDPVPQNLIMVTWSNVTFPYNVIGALGQVIQATGTSIFHSACATITYTSPANPNESCVVEVCEPLEGGGPGGGGSRLSNYYPNPTSGVLMMEITALADEKATMQLSDYVGRPMLEKTFESLYEGKNSLYMDISSLNAGYYQMKVTVGPVTTVVKVVKQ